MSRVSTSVYIALADWFRVIREQLSNTCLDAVAMNLSIKEEVVDKTIRTFWNPQIGTPDRADLPLHAIALSVLLLGAALALPAGAAGGTGGQPTSDTSLHAGSGGSDTQGGSGGLNDTTVNAHGGDGGASTEAGASAGSSADIGSFAGAT